MRKLIALFIVLVSFGLMLGLGACTKAKEKQEIPEKPKGLVENVTEQNEKTTDVIKDEPTVPVTATAQDIETEAILEEIIETTQTAAEGGALVEESPEPVTE